MKKRLKIEQFIVITAIFSIHSLAMAANTHYCAHSASYIQLGDTTAQVAAACGQPTQTHTQAKQATNNQPIEIWSYNASKLVSPDSPPITNFINTSKPTNNMPLKLEMVSGVVKRISYNNVALNDISVCQNRATITVGESMQSVLQKCGKPTGTTLLTQAPLNTQSANQTTTWDYNDGYGAGFTLTFSNGRLTQITAT